MHVAHVGEGHEQQRQDGRGFAQGEPLLTAEDLQVLVSGWGREDLEKAISDSIDWRAVNWLRLWSRLLLLLIITNAEGRI